MKKPTITVALALALVCWPLQLGATTTGPLSPASASNVAGIGIDWSNPGNVTVSDNLRATASLLDGESTDRVRPTNFGFSIPSGSTIEGIQVEVERCRSAGTGTLKLNLVQLRTGGADKGASKSGENFTTACASEIYESFGGATDTWGSSWTAEQINATDFQSDVTCAAFPGDATCAIDHVRLTVTFTPGLVNWDAATTYPR